uniref:Secreted protein n=1 Tax=Steinernema glaseri TaxID=37863 RepID=A0A1I7YDU2_9BILA
MFIPFVALPKLCSSCRNSIARTLYMHAHIILQQFASSEAELCTYRSGARHPAIYVSAKKYLFCQVAQVAENDSRSHLTCCVKRPLQTRLNDQLEARDIVSSKAELYFCQISQISLPPLTSYIPRRHRE